MFPHCLIVQFIHMCSATVGVIQRGRRLCSWSLRPCVSRHCPSSGPRLPCRGAWLAVLSGLCGEHVTWLLSCACCCLSRQCWSGRDFPYHGLMTTDRAFLEFSGGLPSNSLINILELKNKRNAHNELQIMHQSSYFDHTKFKLFAERNKNNFTI